MLACCEIDVGESLMWLWEMRRKREKLRKNRIIRFHEWLWLALKATMKTAVLEKTKPNEFTFHDDINRKRTNRSDRVVCDRRGPHKKQSEKKKIINKLSVIWDSEYLTPSK